MSIDIMICIRFNTERFWTGTDNQPFWWWNFTMNNIRLFDISKGGKKKKGKEKKKKVKNISETIYIIFNLQIKKENCFRNTF